MLFFDDKRLVLSEFIKFIDISKENIKVEYKNYKLFIVGTNLVVSFYQKKEMMIKGRIMEIKFIYE